MKSIYECRRHNYNEPLEYEGWTTHHSDYDWDEKDYYMVAEEFAEQYEYGDPDYLDDDRRLIDVRRPGDLQFRRYTVGLEYEPSYGTEDSEGVLVGADGPELVVRKAITLIQPWGEAVLHGGKDIENRTWMIHEVPQWVAVHYGSKCPVEEVEAVKMLAPDLDLTRKEPGIYGLMHVTRCGVEQEHPDNPWAVGPWCWEISEVLVLDEPILMPGALSLWSIPEKYQAELRERIRAAVELQKQTPA